MSGVGSGSAATYVKSSSDGDEMENNIKDSLFYKADLSEVTEEVRNEIIQNRYAYVKALANGVLELSNDVRDKIKEDLSILKDAKTTGGGNINQVQFMVQTKKTMVEQKAADIMLQARLFEMEAAQMLLNLNPQYINDPSKTEK